MHISKRGIIIIGICCATVVASYIYYKGKNTDSPIVSPVKTSPSYPDTSDSLNGTTSVQVPL